MKVIVFDMDDTLYDEFTYVRSGFLAVAAFLSPIVHVHEEEIFEWMWHRLQHEGRGAIFDDVLKKYHLFSKGLAKKCVSVYRLHKPEIILPKETVTCLKQLELYPLYLVTDGNKIAQHNKVEALGLYEKMKHCYVTHRYGVHNAKPSPYCFLHIMKCEQVQAENIVYVGDNSRKDFVGIKPLGFRTIRIMTGQHKDVEMPPEYEAEFRIDSINELPEMLEEVWPDFKTVRK